MKLSLPAIAFAFFLASSQSSSNSCFAFSVVRPSSSRKEQQQQQRATFVTTKLYFQQEPQQDPRILPTTTKTIRTDQNNKNNDDVDDGFATRSIQELTKMLEALEAINNECTEEGNQTKQSCDVRAMDQRLELIERLNYQIATKRFRKARLEQCLANPSECSLEEALVMKLDLENLNNLCTEEGNQTDDECDPEQMTERAELIQQVEALASKIIENDNANRSDDLMEQRVQDCLANPQHYDLEEMTTMLLDLEALNFRCTEEGNQTDEECDPDAIDERSAMFQAMEKLAFQVDVKRIDWGKIDACLAASDDDGCSVDELTRMLHDLETIQYSCSEEGNQTNQECSLEAKEQRDIYIERLTTKIANRLDAQAQECTMLTDHDDDASFYSLGSSTSSSLSSPCTIAELKATLNELEALQYSCSEEGNQTKPQCSLEQRAERESLMENLRLEIELAEKDLLLEALQQQNLVLLQQQQKQNQQHGLVLSNGGDEEFQI